MSSNGIDLDIISIQAWVVEKRRDPLTIIKILGSPQEKRFTRTIQYLFKSYYRKITSLYRSCKATNIWYLAKVDIGKFQKSRPVLYRMIKIWRLSNFNYVCASDLFLQWICIDKVCKFSEFKIWKFDDVLTYLSEYMTSSLEWIVLQPQIFI